MGVTYEWSEEDREMLQAKMVQGEREQARLFAERWNADVRKQIAVLEEMRARLEQNLIEVPPEHVTALPDDYKECVVTESASGEGWVAWVMVNHPTPSGFPRMIPKYSTVERPRATPEDAVELLRSCLRPDYWDSLSSVPQLTSGDPREQAPDNDMAHGDQGHG